MTNQTLNNTNFYLKTFPAKLNDKIFQNNKKKPYCGVIFAQRELLIKTLAK